MKLGAFIEALKQFDPDLVVTLADWNEAYAQDNADVIKDITVQEWGYIADNKECKGKHLVIGWSRA